ncbi:unnamed protein product [Lathyrus oleraceus]|uniref:Uncharacterized protein n=1 Tax=Pisum sativum TaxID=3888 RepID=A0A9D4WWM9_PEA|nr:uncharacterized protein LOC127084251 isoform X2 [Pisum sativum]KAI5408070.1 hypothetical protein KIW84_054059 [Pisum sativum]
MATAAFKSTTKRIPVGASSGEDSHASSSSLHHRRSRSLSRPARPLSSRDSDSDISAPRGKFVNTVRGSGFPEISLDDLAIEFFDSANRGRVNSRSSESETSSLRRGRSVSRRSSGVGEDRRSSIGGGGKTSSDASSRRRRSVSVVRCQISDSESDLDRSQNSKSRANLKNIDIGNKVMHKPVASDQRQVLKKSLSQKDLRSYDGYSSHSSVLTDDEGANGHIKKSGSEKLRAVHSHKKVGLVDMANETFTYKAAGKSRASPLSLDDRLLSDNSNAVQAVSSVRRSYESELEQSEKRKQDLLAEIVFEEQRGRELSKIVNELSPPKKSNSIPEPPRARKKSNDRNRMSMRLTEEAERYIEDFISNVEDTDISSLDGERSDTSSSIGGLIKPETFYSPPLPRPLPVLMDGVTLPWLQWETSNDATPKTTLNKALLTLTPNSATASSTQDNLKDQGNPSISSRGSWSPDYLKDYIGKDVYSKLGKVYSNSDQSSLTESKGLRYDIDEYLKVKSSEDFLTERLKQQQRINSGCLLLCNIRLC